MSDIVIFSYISIIMLSSFLLPSPTSLLHTLFPQIAVRLLSDWAWGY